MHVRVQLFVCLHAPLCVGAHEGVFQYPHHFCCVWISCLLSTVISGQCIHGAAFQMHKYCPLLLLDAMRLTIATEKPALHQDFND